MPSATAWSAPGSSWLGPAAWTPVVLCEVARMVGVVPSAAYRHFADREEFIAEKEHLPPLRTSTTSPVVCDQLNAFTAAGRMP